MELAGGEVEWQVMGQELIMNNPHISNIKTVAVVAARSDVRSLSDQLKAGRYVVIPLSGRPGKEQDGIAVLNISLDTALYYFRRHDLASFFFLTSNGGLLESGYWELQDQSRPYGRNGNPYVQKDTFSSVMVADAAGDCQIMVRGINITIPFSILRQIDDNLDKLIMNNMVSDKDGIIGHTIEKVGLSPYIWRGAIYRGVL